MLIYPPRTQRHANQRLQQFVDALAISPLVLFNFKIFLIIFLPFWLVSRVLLPPEE